MLVDEVEFERISAKLEEDGKVDAFVAENGPIEGRMMVTIGEPPADSDFEVKDGEHAFIGSFDFIDCAMGIIVDPKTGTPSSGVWVIRQSDSAQPPRPDFIDMFARTLMAGIDDDGTVHMPTIAYFASNGNSLVYSAD